MTTLTPGRSLVEQGPIAPIAHSERSFAPDLARGLMLLFIGVANVIDYLYGRGWNAFGYFSGSSVGDRVSLFLEQLLAAERTRPMFAILYGFGIAVMASRMSAGGLDRKAVRKVLRRRSWWLIAFGALHATLLFQGDVLAAYGATGLIALGLVQLSDRALRRWLWGSLAYVAVGALALLAFLMTYVSAEAPAPDHEPARWALYLDGAITGAVSSAAAILVAGLLCAFLPLVIAGIMVHRAGWLDHPADHLGPLRATFWSGMAVNVASALPVALIAGGVWHPTHGISIAAVYVTLLGGMYAGLGYICGFALLANKLALRGRRGLPGALASLGERSLTGYLGESLILAPLLSPWGLAWGDGLGYLPAFGLAVGAWAIMLGVAVLMDRKGIRGPFEVLLRRLVYRPRQAQPPK